MRSLLATANPRTTATAFGVAGLIAHTGSGWFLVEEGGVTESVYAAMLVSLAYVLPVTIATILIFGVLTSDTEAHYKLYQAGGVIFLASIIVTWIDRQITGSVLVDSLSGCLDNPDIHVLVKPLCFGAAGFETLTRSYGLASLLAGAVYGVGIMVLGYQLGQRNKRTEYEH